MTPENPKKVYPTKPMKWDEIKNYKFFIIGG
jgi:hypothetical protein